jgi:hypothetical protein
MTERSIIRGLMLVRELRHRPHPWPEHRRSVRHRWILPLYGVEWLFQWLAYLLSRWAFLEVLEYLGILSVLFGVIFYYSESGDRRKQKHYQAWQVINTAQGKGGSGGRLEALQELNADGVPLVGVDTSSAFLQGVRLPQANLARADFSAVDARDSILERSNLQYAVLQSGNFRRSNLRHANLQDADLEDADLVGADLSGANLSGTNLKNADLRNCDLRGITWRGIKEIGAANLHGVRNPPAGFVAWALMHGAISVEADSE